MGAELANRSRFDPAIAAGALLALMTAVWLYYETPADDLVLFVALQIGYVLVPGALAYLALSGGPRTALRVAVVGAAVGYALLIAFYAAASAANADLIFWAGPPLVALVAGIALWRRREPVLSGEPWTSVEVLAATVVIGVAVLFVGIDVFADLPIPRSGDFGFAFQQDIVWQTGIAATFQNVWPPEIPSLSGRVFHYHYFANLNEAASAEAIGAEQFIVNFRLMPAAMMLLVAAGLVELGRTIGRGAWAGIATAALLLFLGPFDPIPLPPGPFFRNLYISDSFAFGLALFVPLLCELVDRIREPAEERGDPGARAGPWLVILLLLVACGGAKSAILPVLGGGLAVALAYALWRSREQVRSVSIALGLTVFAWVATYLAIFRGVDPESHGLETVSFSIAKRTPDFAELTDSVPDAAPVRLAAYVLETAAGTIEAIAPLLVGLVLLPFLGKLWRSTATVLCLGILVVGALAWSQTAHPGQSQNFFLYYGYVAAGAVSAAAIVEFLRSEPATRSRVLRVAVPVLAVVAIVGIVTPTPYKQPSRLTLFKDDYNQRMTTPQLIDGLRWVRDETPDDSVLAVNNAYLNPDQARNCSYTAFSGRRVMLECEYGGVSEGYPPLRDLRTGEATHPFAQRFRLNERIFRKGSPEAIDKAADRYGVDYLFVDRRFVGSPRAVERLGRAADLIYEADGVLIYEVR